MCLPRYGKAPYRGEDTLVVTHCRCYINSLVRGLVFRFDVRRVGWWEAVAAVEAAFGDDPDGLTGAVGNAVGSGGVFV